jgi:hypothetical protein
MNLPAIRVSIELAYFDIMFRHAVIITKIFIKINDDFLPKLSAK